MKNQVQIIGTIGRDAEEKVLADNTKILNFSVATNERYTDKSGEKKQTTTWFNCSMFIAPNQNTRIGQFLLKGTMVFVQGKVSARAYLNAQGQPIASLDIRVSDITLLSAKKDSDNQDHPAQENQAPEGSQNPNAAAENNSSTDDLPF